MTIPMALFDMVPVLLFLCSAGKLSRCYYRRFSRQGYTLFSGGSIMVFTAGLFKAVWKLLYAAQICDFEKLNQCFFPLQSTGFLLLGLGAASLLRRAADRQTTALSVAAPAVFGGTMLFVLTMILGLGAFCGSFFLLSLRQKKRGTALLFGLAFLGMLGMGYLSSRNFTQASMNWIAELLNTAAQLCLLGGVTQICRDEAVTA